MNEDITNNMHITCIGILAYFSKMCFQITKYFKILHNVIKNNIKKEYFG